MRPVHLLPVPCAALLVALAAVPAGQEAAAPERFTLALAEDAALELRAAWEPCRDSLYGLFASTPALKKPTPAQSVQRYGAAAFQPFLPPEPVALGQVWEVDGEAVLAFLRQFHAGARREARFNGGEVPGTYACLRAVAPDAFEILLRAHAVFELEDGVIYKPAQYEGRLVLDRGTKALRAFHLALPDRDTNVDVNVPMEYLQEGRMVSGFSADIGWVPRMELTSGAPPSITWTHEVPDDEARVTLRRWFYVFAKLDWLPFEEAVLAARELQKPLHLVLVFGALDDDSC